MSSSLLRSSLLRATASSSRSQQTRLLSYTLPRWADAGSPAVLTSGPENKDPQLGDYPEVPFKSYQLRKHDKNWWDPQEKRNFGEPLHEQDDILSVWAPDLHETVKPTTALFQLGVMASAIASVACVIYYFTPEKPALPRTYPRDGLAQEVGNPLVAAWKEGDFDAKDEEEEEEDDE